MIGLNQPGRATAALNGRRKNANTSGHYSM